MREIPKKNYYFLIVLIVVTIFITLLLASLYKNKTKEVSNFYNYSNNITSKEFNEYLLENTDLIIYMADKYDLSYSSFENNFKSKLDELNLKDKFVYIDKSELNEKFLKKLEEKYKIRIDTNRLPVIIVMIDENVINVSYINEGSNAEEIINYEAFE